MKLFSGCSVLVAIVFFDAGCKEASPRPLSPPAILRLSMGPAASGLHRLGEALADASRAALPGARIEVRPSAGVMANIDALEAADADIGVAFSDAAYFAFVGQLEPDGRPFDRLRGIAVLPLSPINLVVSARSGIRDATGLRGTRVIVSGAGTARTVQVVLKAYGVDLDFARVDTISAAEIVRRFDEGTLDAVFLNGHATIRAVLEAGGRTVPLSGPVIDALRREYPFIRPVWFPEGEYSGGAIHTISVNLLLVCRSDLDEALVYAFTKSFFDVLPRLSTMSPLLEFMASTDVGQAPATPIPLHEGAARYYREREIFR